jgi:hypothetical protein
MESTDLETIEMNRKACMQRQSELRRIMAGGASHVKAIALFLEQHARLYSARMEPTGFWSYEDAVLDDIPAHALRRHMSGHPHSLAWLVWHMARCEDITINLQVAGSAQVLLAEN